MRAAESAMRVMPRLYAQPIINVPVVQQWTGFSRPGSQEVINRFIEMKILSPMILVTPPIFPLSSEAKPMLLCLKSFWLL